MSKEQSTNKKNLTKEKQLIAPALSKQQTELLQKLYYDDNMIFGRDKMKAYVDTNHKDLKISRRQIATWLSSQEINQIHKQHEKPKTIKSTVLDRAHIQIGIDLIDMQNFELKGMKYVLNAVDLFSRKFYSVPQSNGSIERFNGTLKRLIYKSMELKNDFDWVANLDKLVDNPREMVRIYEPSDLMKGANWSDKLYKIEKIFIPKKDFTVFEYKLVGLTKKFREQDLQKVSEIQNETNQQEFFKVSKIVEPLIKNNEAHYEVAWKGYRKKSDNTIEPREQLLKDIPFF
mmetsp:Transcript_34534/g.40643  ORF Transcript_34534/g.40643 Transcript_34534/m.40643 type:complete len:288 (+) Transcript_34534:164-1027(+)